jgi:hypothetical protein
VRQAFIIRWDGSTEVVELPEDDSPCYDVLSQAVGGWLELVPSMDPSARHLTIYCNEMGKIEGLPLNPKATDLTARWGIDPIVGDIIVTGPPDRDGRDTSLSEKDIVTLKWRFA